MWTKERSDYTANETVLKRLPRIFFASFFNIYIYIYIYYIILCYIYYMYVS